MSGQSVKMDQPVVTEALNSIAEALLGEKFKEIFSSIKTIEISLTNRIESNGADTDRKIRLFETEANAKIESMDKKIDALAKQVSKDTQKVEEKLGKSVDELRRSLDTMGETFNTSLLDTRKTLEKNLTTYKDKTLNNFRQIDEVLKEHQQDIIQQAKDSKRMSKILQNFARVLTDPGDSEEKHLQKMPAKIAENDNNPASSRDKKPASQKQSAGDLPDGDNIAENIDQIFQS